LNIDWKADSSILITGFVSMMCWLIFVVAVTSLQNQAIGSVFLIVAFLALLRFGQLLDKSLKGTI